MIEISLAHVWYRCAIVDVPSIDMVNVNRVWVEPYNPPNGSLSALSQVHMFITCWTQWDPSIT